jgi:molecular chaperone HscB
MNYFELFEIPVQLKPSPEGLKKKFYELSKRYHPDYHSQASENEKMEVLEKSSMLNKAWKTLQEPDDTIKYVLQLKGILEEEEKYSLPPGFLMEMLEISEQAMEAKMEGDAELVARSREQVAEIQKQIYEPVKEIIEHYQDSSVSEKELLQVKEYYYKKKYLNRILEGLR